METILPLFFSVLLITFVTMSAICLYDMYRMAKSAERRGRDNAAGRGRGRHLSSAERLVFLRRNSQR